MTKIKIQIKSRWTDSILFESKNADNTFKGTLIEAVKNKTDLAGADLRDAYLGGADLRDAFLRDADLRGAELGDADLRGADLRDADLGGVYLGHADLRSADLRSADLHGAFLGGADLGGADLRGAELRAAFLRGAEGIPYVPLACPSDGAFIGWKKVDRYLVKLEIPEDAKRSSATTNMCRCDKAKVLDIICTSDDNPLKPQEITNFHYTKTIYKVGKMVYADSFDPNRWNEGSHGIHFFINKQDAINY